MRTGRLGTGRTGRQTVSVVLFVSAIAVAGLAPPALAADPGPDVVVGVTTSATGNVSVGDAFTFTISVSNTGDQAASGVVLVDDLPVGLRVTGPLLPPFPGGSCSVLSGSQAGGPPFYSVVCTRGALAAGASVDTTFDVVVTGDVRCGTVTNEVSAKAANEPKANRGNNTASLSLDITCPPSLSLTKTAPRFARVGDRVAFTMRATNTGAVPFDRVRVSDPGCRAPATVVSDGDGDTILDPRETWVFRCSSTVTAATPHLFTTTATVLGHSPEGRARAVARATVRVVHPRVTMLVIPSSPSGAVGDVITYRYVVRNTGDATLSSLVVTDDRLGAIGTIPRLSPGHAVTFRATRVLSASDVWVVNSATVTAEEPTGRTVTASANAAITIVAATGDGASNSGRGGTAFTGVDATGPLARALVLALIGLALLAATRRRA